ncbi:MAG: hypothetical protein WCE30_05885 [Mycobacterium sp.]
MQAAQTMINDVAMTPHLRNYPDIESVMATIGSTHLEAPRQVGSADQ